MEEEATYRVSRCLILCYARRIAGLTAVDIVTPEQDSLFVRPHQVLVSAENNHRVAITEVQLIDGVRRSVSVDVYPNWIQVC